MTRSNFHRWYQAGSGRYSRPDPLPLGWSDLNVYLYASANPLINTDPLGLRVTPVKPPSPPIVPRPSPPPICPRPQTTPSPRVSTSSGVGSVAGAFFTGLFMARHFGNQTLEDVFGPRENPDNCDRCGQDQDPPDRCDDLYANDTRICGFWAARRNMRNYSACMDSAMKLYSECRVKGIFPPRIPLALLPFGQN